MEEWRHEQQLRIEQYEYDLRDRLAMAALTGILASYANPNALAYAKADDAARNAYSIADAMMVERKS
jgi:hypothetical protein